ncbi:hypothetical protein P4H71_22750 [Paenibacillus kribbensis]|uniref:hypothetical protein n=1 Tax=Paenibacillus TaxID=44249 RepID=UPI00024F0417|nr:MULTISPECIES: hypothetical protein [Paenibacillus]EHS56865.1 hypothetical protein WG8_3135 [Paenibacillus sp. Aloe-11]MEC0237146.1 hypothetical protein [Paenibacillus kribbensis]
MSITLGFIRNRRDNLVIITVGNGRKRQELRITSELFFTIIPQANPFLYGGNVKATPAQLVELGFELDAEMKREVFRVVRPLVTPAQVRYVLDPITGNYILRYIGTRQELAIQPRAFWKIAGVSQRSPLGSLTLSMDVMNELGFIVGKGGVRVEPSKLFINYA